MRRVGPIALAGVSACLGALGCGGGAAGGPTACPALWSVTDSRGNPGLDVQVADGALSIAAPLEADELISVSRESQLTGDFHAAFDFEAFSPGGASTYLHMTLDLDDPNLLDVPFVGSGVGVNDGETDVRALLVYHDESRTRFDLVLTPATSGTLLISRVGRSITLSASVPSGEAATLTAEVSDAPTRIGLQFANGSKDTPAGDASVRITDFRVTGGGGDVTTDHFDCDSLL